MVQPTPLAQPAATAQAAVQAVPPATAPEPPDEFDAGLDDGDALPAVGRVWDEERVSLSSAMARGGGAAAPSFASVEPELPVEATSMIDERDLRQVWTRLLGGLRENRSVGPLLAQGRLKQLTAEQAVIVVPPGSATVARLKSDVIRAEFQRLLGRLVNLIIEADAAPATAGEGAKIASAAPAGGGGSAAPAPGGGAPSPEQRRQLAGDPLIRGLMEQFGATIVRVENHDV
jgi:hypothetical protein